jgi:uncharacterized protein YndB with AHSA1/START domain
MPDILHRVEIKASAADVFHALTTRQGLAGWWTDDTRGGFEVGGVIAFRFGKLGGFDMKVVDLQTNRLVQWEVVDGPPEWMGTSVSFALKDEPNDATAILFKHQGWKEPVEFMHHCSTKWAVFLLSIKSLLETGQGTPYPKDIHITVNAD